MLGEPTMIATQKLLSILVTHLYLLHPYNVLTTHVVTILQLCMLGT